MQSAPPPARPGHAGRGSCMGGPCTDGGRGRAGSREPLPGASDPAGGCTGWQGASHGGQTTWAGVVREVAVGASEGGQRGRNLGQAPTVRQAAKGRLWQAALTARCIPHRCWLRSPAIHSVLVMGYGGLTSLFNLVVLAWALRALRRLRAREKTRGSRACRDTVLVLGLTVLLGTTWALAFFSFGVFLVPQLFLFTIFNSLYGFFLFLWFCSRRCSSEAEAKVPMEAPSSSQMVL
uniref:G-protein coupled receptors family 2 profile 2 domain-containing protein n=1 Tax=Oryctolagus cuniculus TaxID=9986 RepID=A0A5F9DAN1_RABIT